MILIFNFCTLNSSYILTILLFRSLSYKQIKYSMQFLFAYSNKKCSINVNNIVHLNQFKIDM